jgi:hypothetical protein
MRVAETDPAGCPEALAEPSGSSDSLHAFSPNHREK